jgi:AraC-like DNA-binding protein
MKRPNDHPARIQRVVDYLADHLDETLDLETIARVAHVSPYHFHRIYRGLLAETVKDTVRRLRLHRSAIDLLDRNLSIDRFAQRAATPRQPSRARSTPNTASRPVAIVATNAWPGSIKQTIPQSIVSRSLLCLRCASPRFTIAAIISSPAKLSSGS